jgi:hypothetical protein
LDGRWLNAAVEDVTPLGLGSFEAAQTAFEDVLPEMEEATEF